ncbi:hypothetical protein EVAR_16404_1 [Eumeta japonica]|uniref:Uncharacterized protein n=1 Tax=Eumeta variegata TaxID=151549 RepID=A0A4C1VT69_EUMVA|nr:hypothetical protein EVAR_16404_1 [Eumeta japonica]
MSKLSVKILKQIDRVVFVLSVWDVQEMVIKLIILLRKENQSTTLLINDIEAADPAPSCEASAVYQHRRKLMGQKQSP